MKEVLDRLAVHLSDVDHRAIVLTHSKIDQIRFSRNKLDIGISYDETKFKVFLAKRYDGQRKTIEFEGSTEEDVLEKINFFKFSLDKLPPNPLYGGMNEISYSYPKPRYDEKLLEMDAKGAVEQAIEAALSAGAKRVAGTLYIYDTETYLKTKFTEGYDRNVYASLSVRAFIDKTISGHRVNSVSKSSDFDPEETGRKAGEMAKLDNMNRIKVPAGKYKTILGPLAAAGLLGTIGRMTSAAAVVMGFSPFTFDKLGKKIASEKFTFISSADKEFIGYRLFDEEGVPVKETKIFDKGTFKTHLHSTSTANLLKAKGIPAEPTGNAGILYPHARQLIVEPGDSSFEEMVENVDRGLFVSNVRYTRFQSYVTGDFSTIPRDTFLYIENGKIKGSVRGLRLNGNVIEFLKNIRALSKDRYPIYRREAEIPTVTPYLLVEDVAFTEAR